MSKESIVEKQKDLTDKINSLNRGYYVPSFFKLGISTYQNLDNFNILDDETLSVFFHEYIHFLQDITTSFGLLNCTMTVDRMKFINNDIRQNGNTNFSVPYDLSSNKMININEKIQVVYLGDRDSSVGNIIVHNVIEANSNIILPKPYNKPLTYAKLTYTSSNVNNGELNFGAYCIIESMAHIAQNKFFNVKHNDIPYHSAELVAKQVYSIIGNNLLYVFALCDASLMSYQPGLVFLRSLEMMRTNKFIPQNEYEVYDYVFRNFKAETINLMSHFSWLSGFANLQLLGYFTTPIFENEKQWINYLLKHAHSYRINNPYFLIDIIKGKTLKSSKFLDVFNQLGTPLMVNETGRNWFHPPISCSELDIKPDRLAAILEIFELFEYGKTECDLIDFCGLQEEEEIVDDRCNCPWTRSKDSRLCGYAVQWRTWGLSDYKPIKK